MLCVTLWLATSPAEAERSTPRPIDDGFDAPLAKSAADVNEGSLEFLKIPPVKQVHHHHNAITLNRQTLTDGWAALTQCHQYLDQVGSAQIVFNPERLRGLSIISHSGMGKAWVENSSVQMQNIGPGAKLCIAAQSRVLYNNGDGSYTMKNGPFMRKFLDGFYPMHVSMQVKYDGSGLHFERISPLPQEGLVVLVQNGELNLDTWFAGKLNTEIRFASTPAP